MIFSDHDLPDRAPAVTHDTFSLTRLRDKNASEIFFSRLRGPGAGLIFLLQNLHTK